MKIKDQKHTTEVPDESHFIERVTQTSPDILYIINLDTKKLVYFNRNIANDLGYSDSEIANMDHPLFDNMHPDDIPLMLQHFKDLKKISDGEVSEIEYRLLKPDGTLNWFCDRNAIFKRNKEGVPIEKIGISQNITLRKLGEIELTSNLNLLQQAEQMTEMGTWVYMIPTGEFKWSEGMYRLFNIDSSQHVSPEIYLEHSLPEERPLITRIVNNIQKDFKAFEEIITIVPGDSKENRSAGTRKLVKVKAKIIRDSKDEPLSVIGTDHDITKHAEATERINKLNKKLLASNRELAALNSELKTFNNIAANDYQDTLKNLYTCMEFIIANDAKNLSNSGKANIRRAQAAIQKMKLLTNDIVSYSSVQSLESDLSIVDLREIIKTEIEFLDEKLKEAQAKINFDELPVIQGYPLLLSSLFHHLLTNCLKFRREEEELIISIKYSVARSSSINVEDVIPDITYGVISISDNGIGFDSTYNQSIFDMFFRAHEKGKYKGSGVGLAICKKIMNIHEGFIIAEGGEQGATFSCYFPIGSDKMQSAY